MNMLTVDPDPPNLISSFLKTLTFNDSREPFVLPVVEDSDLGYVWNRHVKSMILKFIS